MSKATSVETQTLKETFRSLVSDWKARKSHSSCVEDMVMEPAYQRIIGLGPDAIPLILQELERAPDHWFWALYAITGVDPVPAKHRGKTDWMSKAWLDWGRNQGYRW